MITTTLAAFPSPAQGVWYLGPIPIRAYAVCIIAGIVAALMIGDRRWAARGGEPGVIYDIALWAVPFGLIGGRLYHVLTDWTTYFGPGGAGPVAALRIWDGGLGIWGAVALGGVGAWIGCRRRGIPLPAFGDAIAPGIVLAQAIGRLGNYFKQELYGRETDVPWAMEIFYRQDPSGMVDVHSLNGVSTGEVAAVVHPTFLYELLWNLLVFVLLLLIDRWWKIGHGRLFASYVALYCVGRFWVELLRDDTATLIAGIRINSYTSMFVFLGAVVYIILAPKGREDASLLRGRDVFDGGRPAPELAEELVAVAGGTGVVAAAKAAGAEDFGYDADATEPEAADDDTGGDEADAGAGEVAGESEAEGAAEAEAAEGAEEVEEIGEAEPEVEAVDAESADAEDEVEGQDAGGKQVEEPEAAEEAEEPEVGEQAEEPEAEDEAILEAEAVAPGVEVESAAEAEEELIDDEHDPVDDAEFGDFLGEDDGDTPDVVEEPSADTVDAPSTSDPEVVDAVIDEAVAIEQVTDLDDGGDADQTVDGEEPPAVEPSVADVDRVDAAAAAAEISDADVNADAADGVDAADGAEAVVPTVEAEDSDTDEALADGSDADEAPEDSAAEDEPEESAPEPDVATDAASEPDVAEPQTAPAQDPAEDQPKSRSRLGRLFRRRR